MNKDPSSNRIPVQVMLGALVIVMGVLFLLDNLNILDFHGVIRFWPMVFIVVGLIKMADTSSPNGHFLGAILIFIGAMMTLNRFGFFYFSWRTLWPVLLILLGGMVVYRAIAGRRQIGAAPKGDGSSDAVADITAILGGIERRLTTPAFRGGEITAIMGGCVLDMRESSMEGEAVLNVFAVCGGITIKVPPDWTVSLHGTPIMGGFEEKTIVPPTTAKRLVVRGYAIMGGVEVRN
jgi:predicted membrane protein